MSEVNEQYPTILGVDAKFKGELSFEKGVRIEGAFEGQIDSKGSLHVAEGAKIAADIEAANVTIEGQCKGNLTVSEKLHLMATARLEGDLKTNRLEIADGAIFLGKVVVGQASAETTVRRPVAAVQPQPTMGARDPSKPPAQPPMAPGAPRPRVQDIRIPAGS